MKQRINFYEKGFQALTPLFGFGKYLSKCRIERNLLHLIEFRISQINGCAYCLDMHSKDLRAEGEAEQRIYMLDAWKEASIYSAREKAAFRWAEAVTLLKDKEVSDEVYDEAVSQFSDEEMIDLTIAVLAINCYNRLNVAFRTPAGDYQPGQHAALNS